MTDASGAPARESGKRTPARWPFAPEPDPAEACPSGPGASSTLAAQLIVLAKAPVPGRVKTRLTPPFTPQEAATLAEAALVDTLEAGASASFARHLLFLDDQRAAPGTLRAELPARFEVSPQRGRGLDERIAAAFDDAYAQLAVPVVLIGMDTPQVTPGLLETVAQPLAAGDADAVFGPAEDGGFWLLGLRKPDPQLILGVPMSADHTGRVQLDRLREAGLRVRQVPELLDVDTAEDAERVARQARGSRFAATLAALIPGGQDQPALTGRHHQARPAPVDDTVAVPG
jgi:rSAM/selenodomain-associated transferase 1